MQVFRISSLVCNVAMLCTVIAANMISPNAVQGSPNNASPNSRVSSQGQCGSFVKQCFKTCFALGKVKVAYSCTYNAGIYGAFCGCSGLDQTNIALSKAGIPASTVTTTLQTTKVATTVVTDTSIATTQTTATASVQTSVCSYTTIASTILVTTTVTGSAAIVTSTATITTSTTTTLGPFFTSAVPAAVVSLGSTAGSKRDLVARGSNFCSEIQLACTVGCALQWSTPATQVCQASARSGQYNIACICKNKVNVVQKVIQNFNLFKPSKSQCTPITTTSVAATSTVTATSVSVAVITSRVTVVPTTVVSVLTSTVTATMTYACPTTFLTTSLATDTLTPTTTVLATISTTVTTVVAAASTMFYVSAAVSDAASPSYIAQGIQPGNGEATLTESTGDAQAFVILQVAASDSLYNLVGVGPGDFNGLSLGMESGFSGDDPTKDDAFYGYFEPLAIRSQGPPAGVGNTFGNPFETAIWKIDLETFDAHVQWVTPVDSSSRIVDLYGFFTQGPAPGAVFDSTALKSQYYIPDYVDITKFTLVPV